MSDSRATPRHTGWLALLGVLVTLAGPVAYVALLTHPWLRSSGAPAWVLMTAGVALCIFALRGGSRWWHRLAFGASAAITLLFIAGFAFATLPAPGIAATMTTAPDFTLPDQEGRAVSLAAELAQGPVLLVFYRGSW
jgi:AhpC/TSA family